MTQPAGEALSASLAAAEADRRADRLDAAAAGYTRVIEQAPDWVAALLGYSRVCRRQGDSAGALALLERAGSLAPEDPEILADLAGARRRCGDAVGARRAAEAALAQQEIPAARYERALAARRGRDLATARSDVDRLLADGVDTAELRRERGLIALAERAVAAAAEHLAQSWAQQPGPGATALPLAIAYQSLNRPGDAWAVLAGASDTGNQPGSWATVAAAVLEALGDTERAAGYMAEAIDAGAAELWLFRRLAEHVRRQDALSRAERILRQGLAAAAQAAAAGTAVPARNWASLANNLAQILLDTGRVAEAVAMYDQALATDPDYERAACNRLLALHYDPEQSAAGIYAAHRAWQQRFAAPLEATATPPVPRAREPRPLRVGILGKKLRRAPALLLYLAAFENLDPAQIELTVYAMGSPPDELTARLRRCAARWRDITDRDDAAAAAQMRADGVDILINKMGHAEGRMGICARKPAPVQVQWGGFNTSALDGMDWFLGDPVETPPGCESQYTERIYRMPDDYVVYRPTAEDAVPIGPLPQTQRGHATFGCLNAPAKINARIAAVWARLLAELPDSRLILKGKVFDDAEASAALLDVLTQAGIPRERLVPYGWTDHAAHLATYNEIDIALDSWPYSGGLTTIEALWMGVPVVTLPGPTFVGRHAASHLTAAGLGDWVVADWDAYIGQAARWARDPAALAQLRAELRARLQAAPLCDGPRFATHLTAALQDIWRRSAGPVPGAAPAESRP